MEKLTVEIKKYICRQVDCKFFFPKLGLRGRNFFERENLTYNIEISGPSLGAPHSLFFWNSTRKSTNFWKRNFFLGFFEKSRKISTLFEKKVRLRRSIFKIKNITDLLFGKLSNEHTFGVDWKWEIAPAKFANFPAKNIWAICMRKNFVEKWTYSNRNIWDYRAKRSWLGEVSQYS